jgi:uncharacterized protein with PQ loop repeat
MSYELHIIRKKNEEPQQQSSLLKKNMDRIAYPIAILGPLSSFDQVLSIWQEKSAAGVSVLVWTVLLCTSSFWILYGIIHREKIILFGHLVWFVLSAIILIEIFSFS